MGQATQTRFATVYISILPDSTETPSASTSTQTPLAFSPTVLIDNEYCLVEAIGVKEDSRYNFGLSKGFELQLRLQNKTADKTINFSCNDEYVNGIKYSDLDFSLYASVAPGKKDIQSMFISSSTIVYNEIDLVSDIELSIRGYDSDTYDDYFEEVVNIYPYGKDKATHYTRPYHETDIVLLDNEYVTVIATEFGEYSNLLVDSYAMRFFAVNKTNKEVSFSFDDVSVNGYMANPLCYTTIKAGMCDFSAMAFSNSYLEDLEITTVEEIEFTLVVEEPFVFPANKYVEETIVVKAPVK